MEDLKLASKFLLKNGFNSANNIVNGATNLAASTVLNAKNTALDTRRSADKIFIEAENFLAHVKMLQANNVSVIDLKVPKLVNLPPLLQVDSVMPIPPSSLSMFIPTLPDNLINDYKTFKTIKKEHLSAIEIQLQYLSNYARHQSNYLIAKASYESYEILKSAYMYYQSQLEHAINIYNEIDNIIKASILSTTQNNIGFVPNPDDSSKQLLLYEGRLFALPILITKNIDGKNIFGTSYPPSKYPYFHGLFKSPQSPAQQVYGEQQFLPTLK